MIRPLGKQKGKSGRHSTLTKTGHRGSVELVGAAARVAWPRSCTCPSACRCRRWRSISSVPDAAPGIARPITRSGPDLMHGCPASQVIIRISLTARSRSRFPHARRFVWPHHFIGLSCGAGKASEGQGHAPARHCKAAHHGLDYQSTKQCR